MEVNMKLSKRIVSAFLAMLMIFSVVTVVGAANVTFTDVSGHWAWNGGQIQYLVDKGVLNGYKQSNGTYTFKPDGEVTRAEFVKMLDETFGLTATTSINFNDVKATDWHYTYFAKAAAQGYLLNYGKSVNPNGKITREEAISLLVRYLDLPASEKASTSYFADYSSITSHYSDYVLRGIYAGLTDGYNENGAKYFKPQKTLTRAEALTILYRAAGCIFNVNAYSRDNNAADTNNVITRGGVILNGINLRGRVIISEGASSGTVSLSGCSVDDTLYIRGTADVTLDDCKIENIVITKGCKLSLLNGTEVENITVYGKSTLGIYSGITVEVLDVENGAENTKVSGDGKIGMAYINAAGFSSSMVPAEFQIGNNLTATFASTQYEGSSDAQASFTMTPFITSDGSNYYLNLFPAADGNVYYYFTNGNNAPTTSSFDSYHDSSSFTGMISVKKGQVVTEKTYSANSVKNFEYVVLQLQSDGRKYAPVMIPNTNTDGNGFSTTPYLADETTIKLVAAQGGTLYWYYAKSGEKRTQVEFLKEFEKTDSALKDSNTIVSGRTSALGLSEKYLKNYDYVVLMLKTGNGSYYTPVVVSAGDNGFEEEPALENVGTISYKTNVSGELYYYYAEDANLPAPDSFKAEYNRADKADHFDVTKNRAGTFKYDVSESEDYPYLIIAIKNKDGDYMQPVAVNINFRTGFRNEPEIEDESTIIFRTEDDGEVMYYYSKSNKVPTVSEFHDEYGDTASRYKDTVYVDDSWERVEYSQTTAQNYPYMVFLFIDDQENEYTPVVLKLDATSDTGFVINPYINKDAVFFKTEEDGEVWYFFSRDGSPVKSSEFEDFYDDVSKSYLYGQVDVNGSKLNYFEIDEDVDFERYPYLVIAFLAEEDADNEDRDFHYPVVLDVEDADLSGSGLNIESVTEKEVEFTTMLDGTVYYYFTESSPSVDSDNFARRYKNADTFAKNDKTCKEDKTFKVSVDEDDPYHYLVICIEIEDSDGDSVYMEPVVVDLDTFVSGSEDGDDDGATTSKTGLDIENYNFRDKTIEITAKYDGEVSVYLYVDGQSKGQIGSFDIDEDESYEFDYSKYSTQIAVLSQTGDEVEIAFQLVNKDETYKSLKVPVLE